jgi:hypothetical protein
MKLPGYTPTQEVPYGFPEAQVPSGSPVGAALVQGGGQLEDLGVKAATILGAARARLQSLQDATDATRAFSNVRDYMAGVSQRLKFGYTDDNGQSVPPADGATYADQWASEYATRRSQVLPGLNPRASAAANKLLETWRLTHQEEVLAYANRLRVQDQRGAVLDQLESLKRSGPTNSPEEQPYVDRIAEGLIKSQRGAFTPEEQQRLWRDYTHDVDIGQIQRRIAGRDETVIDDLRAGSVYRLDPDVQGQLANHARAEFEHFANLDAKAEQRVKAELDAQQAYEHLKTQWNVLQRYLGLPDAGPPLTAPQLVEMASPDKRELTPAESFTWIERLNKQSNPKLVDDPSTVKSLQPRVYGVAPRTAAQVAALGDEVNRALDEERLTAVRHAEYMRHLDTEMRRLEAQGQQKDPAMEQAARIQSQVRETGRELLRTKGALSADIDFVSSTMTAEFERRLSLETRPTNPNGLDAREWLDKHMATFLAPVAAKTSQYLVSLNAALESPYQVTLPDPAQDPQRLTGLQRVDEAMARLAGDKGRLSQERYTTNRQYLFQMRKILVEMGRRATNATTAVPGASLTGPKRGQR